MKVERKATKIGIKEEYYENGKLIPGLDRYHAQLSITTVSLGEILRNFGDMIVSLKADGGITMQPERHRLEDLGIKISEKKSFSFCQNYDTAIHPKLSPIWIKKQFDFMKEHSFDLDKLEKNRHREDVHTVAIPVRELTLRITDDSNEIGELSEEYFNDIGYNDGIKRIDKNRDIEFDITFHSTPCKSELQRMEVAKHEINLELIKNCGFKYSILNCILGINHNQIMSLTKSQRIPIIEWSEDWLRLRSPRLIIQRIKNHINRFETHGYGLITDYSVGKEEKLFVVRAER